MYVMAAEAGTASTFAFAVSKLGQHASARFVELLAPLGLRPRHLGVLEMLRADQPAVQAQHTIATAMRVSNSVVVNMLDELEELGAVRRVRESTDRRRQRVELTDHGRALARQAAQLADQLDAELLAPLTATQTAALRGALRTLAVHHGIAGGGRTG